MTKRTWSTHRAGDGDGRAPRSSRATAERAAWRARCAAPLALALLAPGLGDTSVAGAQGGILRGAGAEFVAAGASRLATHGLDDYLTARGYPAFGRAAFAVGLGGYRILPGGVAFGAEWHGIIQGSEAHAGRRMGFGGGYATLGVARVLQLSSRTRVYPRLGVGVGGLGLWFEPRPEAAVPFDEVLANPDCPCDASGSADGPRALTHTSAVVDVGAGIERRWQRRGRSPLVGLRVGYLAMPARTSWRVLAREVSGGPSATLAGPYVRVTLGTGRWQ